MAALCTALAYYYDDHREELADRERADESARQEGERRIRTLVANGTESVEEAD
ncbi:hypothetical protein [Halorhabdus amylolytica]|uniref:hypothetical protein n=1 Tax=Halorhabdus amylolytica TaxID=2559573 RepID=UPI0020C13110|nr:hypothetical protein [Halorhabdus amylolytica]